MSMLHIVNKSPYERNSLTAAVGHMTDGDTLLLIEDGVYGALSGSAVTEAVQASAADVSIHVLDGDVKARGLDAGKLLGEVTAVGYDGFVDLVAGHDRTQAWL